MVWKAIKKALPAAATAAAGPAAGALVGGTLGLASAKAAAGYNKKSVREQMQFQERMSSTAYQRAADDLEAAGLNRILAIGSPATTPGGASYTTDFGSMVTGAQAGINTASSAQNIKQSEATVKKLIKETDILTEKEKQQAMTSKIVERFGGLLLKATDNVPATLEHITSPQFIEEVKTIIIPDIIKAAKDNMTISPGLSVVKLLASKVGDAFWDTAAGKLIKETTSNIRNHKHNPKRRESKFK